MAAMEGKVAPYSTEPSDKIDDRKVAVMFGDEHYNLPTLYMLITI